MPTGHLPDLPEDRHAEADADLLASIVGEPTTHDLLLRVIQLLELIAAKQDLALGTEAPKGGLPKYTNYAWNSSFHGSRAAPRTPKKDDKGNTVWTLINQLMEGPYPNALD